MRRRAIREGMALESVTQVTWLDFVVLAAYFVMTMGVGFYFFLKGKSSDTEGFTVGGRALSGILVGLSILGTFVSSISFLALPGSAYTGNWNSFVFSLSLPIATIIAIRYFVPFYRNSNEISAYHHLEMRFGPWARLYTGMCFLLMQIVRMGAVTFLMALPMQALLGWDIKVIILITGVSVVLYSMVGGIVAVIWTDAIQALILIAGAVVCAIVLVYRLPEGPSQMFSIAMEHNKFSLGSFGPSVMENTFWVVLIYGTFINLNNFGIDQGYAQRYVAARTDAEACKSLWLGGMLYVPLSVVFFFIGTALFAFYEVFPERLPAGLEGDRVFPYFIVHELPTGVTGLLIAAIFAAAMSTISTNINSGSTIFMTDVYKRYLRPNATDKDMMRALYGSTLVIGTIGIGIAFLMIQAKGILDAWWKLQGIFAGGMLGLFLLGMISRRAGNVAAVTGVVVGVLLIAWMTLSPLATALPDGLKNPMHNYMTVVVGTSVIVLVGMLVAQLAPRPESDDVS